MLKGAAVEEKRSETISVTITPTMLAEIMVIMKQEDRTKSWVAEALIERGLEAYRKDRVLKSKGRDNKLGVIRARTEDAARKSKKL